jgi:hypothetical protein
MKNVFFFAILCKLSFRIACLVYLRRTKQRGHAFTLAFSLSHTPSDHSLTLAIYHQLSLIDWKARSAPRWKHILLVGLPRWGRFYEHLGNIISNTALNFLWIRLFACEHIFFGVVFRRDSSWRVQHFCSVDYQLNTTTKTTTQSDVLYLRRKIRQKYPMAEKSMLLL